MLVDAAAGQLRMRLASHDASQAWQSHADAMDPAAQGRHEGAVGGQDARKARPGSRELGDPVERFAKPLLHLDTPASATWVTPAGTTASQPLKDKAGNIIKANDKGDGFWLQGGAEQIVVNPADLMRSQLGKREFTGWGYDEGNIEVSLVGVPILQHNWFEPK